MAHLAGEHGRSQVVGSSAGTTAVPQRLTAGAHTVTLKYAGNGGTHAKIDAILWQPVIESKVLDDGNGATLAVYKSLTDVESQVVLPTPPKTWTVRVYDRDGNLVQRLSFQSNPVRTVPVPSNTALPSAAAT